MLFCFFYFQKQLIEVESLSRYHGRGHDYLIGNGGGGNNGGHKRNKRYIINNAMTRNLHRRYENRQNVIEKPNKKREWLEKNKKKKLEEIPFVPPYIKKHHKRNRLFMDILHGTGSVAIKHNAPRKKGWHEKLFETQIPKKRYPDDDKIFDDQRSPYKKRKDSYTIGHLEKYPHPNALPGENQHISNDLNQKFNEIYQNFHKPPTSSKHHHHHQNQQHHHHKTHYRHHQKKEILPRDLEPPRLSRNQIVGIDDNYRVKRLKLPFVGIMHKKERKGIIRN